MEQHASWVGSPCTESFSVRPFIPHWRHAILDAGGCSWGGCACGDGQAHGVVRLRGFDMECHMNEENVRVADGPHVRAYGSEGGHGYGWWKRQHCFSPVPDSVGVLGGATAGLSGSGLLGGNASGVGSGTGPGLMECVAENIHAQAILEHPGTCPIADYDAPSETEGFDGTQDSTARDTFPQVSLGLPDYLLCLTYQCTRPVARKRGSCRRTLVALNGSQSIVIQ